MKEVIMHAALVAKSGMVFLGKSHADCFHQANAVGVEVSSKADHQGFFTNRGRFVDRKVAAKIADRAGQLSKPTTVLLSEDLWSPTGGGRFKYDSIKGYFE